MNGTEERLLEAVWARQRGDETCYVGVPDVAQDLGLAPEQVQGQVEALESEGYLEGLGPLRTSKTAVRLTVAARWAVEQ